MILISNRECNLPTKAVPKDMSQPTPEPTPEPASEFAQNTFNISNSSITNLAGSGAIHYHEASNKAEELSQPKQAILFLAANPLSTYRLRLDEEVREIEAGLQRSKHRGRFELKQQWALRPRDLQRALLDCNPQIVHFSGHGMGQSTYAQSTHAQSTSAQSTETHRDISFADEVQIANVEPVEAGLVLEDTTGQPKLVRTEALAALFELFTGTVECVVLNACYSEQQARAIARHVPYVIGMNQAIGDRAAIEFAVGFYDALGAGEPVDFAYRLGCSMIRLSGIAEHLTPVILHETHTK